MFKEADYRFGVGALRIRVEHVARDRPAHYDGDDWYLVEGVEVGPAGDERGHRLVFVRGRLLPAG